MRHLFFLTFLIMNAFSISAQEGVGLTVHFQGIEVIKGKLAIELVDADEVKVGEYWLFVESDTVELFVPDLPVGDYAIRFFHDENNNGALDTNWIGIPTEAFGFSNDVQVRFGKPPLADMIFHVLGDTDIVVNAQKILG